MVLKCSSRINPKLSTENTVKEHNVNIEHERIRDLSTEKVKGGIVTNQRL